MTQPKEQIPDEIFIFDGVKKNGKIKGKHWYWSATGMKDQMVRNV